MKPTAPAGTQAIIRAIRLLKAFSRTRSEFTLTELAREIGLTKTTAHRLLAALCSEGLVERDELSGRYRLGVGVFAMATNMAIGRNLITAAHPMLERLADEFGESASVEVLSAGEVIIVDEVAPERRTAPGPNIGTRWPLHATSTGKIFLAFSRAGTRLLHPPLERYTEQTITDVDSLSMMTGEIRTAGYATSLSELEENFAAVAAPILNQGGIVCGAVCIGGPIERLRQDRLDLVGRRLRVAAQSLSA